MLGIEIVNSTTANKRLNPSAKQAAWKRLKNIAKNIKAVVINPAVKPFELLADYLGPQYNPYQDMHYELTLEHVAALKSFYVETLSQPSNVLLLQQMGDEVLPFQQAVDYFKQSAQHVEFAGDHSFVGFERYFDTVAKFLKITYNKSNKKDKELSYEPAEL